MSGAIPPDTVVAVIGLGSIGMRHLRNAVELGARTIAFDPDARGRARAEQAGAALVRSLGEALDLATTAIVCTPTIDHQAGLDAAVDAGVDALIEKPLSHRPPAARAALSRAARAGTRIYCGFNLRFHPCVIRAHEAIVSGQLGQIVWAHFLGSSYLPDWRPGRDHRAGYANEPEAGGVLFDYSHELDLALHLLGPAELAASELVNTGLVGMSVEDLALLTMRHGAGATSQVHVDFCTRPVLRTFTIRGDLATLHADLQSRKVRISDASGRLVAENAEPGAYADDYVAETAAFLARHDPPSARHLASGEDGLRASEIVVQAREAGWRTLAPDLA